MTNFARNKPALVRLLSLFFFMLAIIGAYCPEPTKALGPGQTRRVNIPHFNGPVLLDQSAVLWFGQVNTLSNYADVRLGYNDTDLLVQLHIFDRRLWYDTTPTPADLENWDAVTLYLNLNGAGDTAPAGSAYRFVSQLSWWEARPGFQAAYQGNGTGWSSSLTSFTTATGFRGIPIDDADDRGWTHLFQIPFASLGLSGPPPKGDVWRMALILHDRDDSTGTPIAQFTWPENINTSSSVTWGELAFGLPTYSPPPSAPGGAVKIRQGLNGAQVLDAHVGGHTICGEPFNPNFFNGWGDANYAGYSQFNIQNQWDVADWPCFSKYYVTFPLDALPANKVVLSATLTIFQFGNASPGQAKPSLVQVFSVAEDWNETRLTWNNAPLALENVAGSWVNPLLSFPGWPGVPATWNVSHAVAQAYANGQPLRLALYSADGDYHSGKYFTSSDSEDWNAAGRPTLDISWGDVNGFSLNSVTPLTQIIDVGGTAYYTFQIDALGNFIAPVSLQATTTSTNLLVTITPAQINPPAQATLTVTHLGINSAERRDVVAAAAGEWHDIEVSATAGSIVRRVNLKLLTGGSQVFLPLIKK